MGRKARFNQAAVDGLLARQAGLITRNQAMSLAMSEDALRHRLRLGGPWQIVLPGVYLSTTGTRRRHNANLRRYFTEARRA